MDSLKNVDESANLLRSQAHVWNHIFNFINSMTLKFAVQLQIPDIITNHGGTMTLSELIEALPINKEKSHFLPRVMHLLVNSGFFVKKTVPKSEEEEEECYTITPTSRLLLDDEPLSMKPYLLAMLDPILMDPWQHMSSWAQNDDVNPFITAHGKSFFEYAGSHPHLNTFFNQAMASDSRLAAKMLVKDFGGVFEGLKSVVDIGGGTGAMSKELASALPHLHCINFDLPHVVADLEGSENVSYVGGDMFKEIPAADAALIKWVLHNWSDEECVKIFKQCKKAIPSKEKGGKVVIIDMVVDEKMDEKSYETQLFFDLLMMINTNGKQRTEKEWAKIFSASGFSDYKLSLFGLRSIIEIYP